MRWRETIGHAGRWRIAFDADGADMDDFNDTILLDIADPSGSGGNMGGNLWEVEVTVPTTPCDNCTLQLVQIMDGNTADPVPDPIGRSSYYQCVDIVIEGTPDDTDNPPDTDEPDTDDPMGVHEGEVGEDDHELAVGSAVRVADARIFRVDHDGAGEPAFPVGPITGPPRAAARSSPCGPWPSG